ncbi:hypothetical protein [Conexibacter sp. SYSU D00693]|uniref:hypothetical protein n=1 Tax=Conexibacter sp. SYSU D00693 TaxID=2812560 RepID=UPI00196AE711|nr:hypothetical protein [Conexibacter sp. SYSU D00693]
MPVEAPPTPQFSDALEDRLRRRAAKPPRGSQALTALAVVLVLGGGAAFVLTTGGDDDEDGRAAATGTSTTRTAPASQTFPSATEVVRRNGFRDPVVVQFAAVLQPEARGGRGLARASAVTVGGRRRLVLAALGLDPQRVYGLWRVGRDGDPAFVGVARGAGLHDGAVWRLTGGGRSTGLLLTQETTDAPGQPGPTVLRGVLQPVTRRAQPQVTAQVNLRPMPGAPPKAVGVANLVVEDGQLALALVGQGLRPGSHYAIFLVSPTAGARDPAQFLGFAPPVAGRGDAKGRLQGLAALRARPAEGTLLVVARQRDVQARQPQEVVLRGRF